VKDLNCPAPDNTELDAAVAIDQVRWRQKRRSLNQHRRQHSGHRPTRPSRTALRGHIVTIEVDDTILRFYDH
jgi:hypothetical protein